MSDRVRVRFAPSPTGELHIGNARTALFNWLFARRHNGEMVLRIEDTDLDRSATKYITSTMKELQWMGIRWDEGPDVGGPYGPYRQTERLEIYHEFLERLKQSDQAYPCYCSQEDLERERKEQLARGLPPRYSGRCRRLTQAERDKLENEGMIPTLRFRVGSGAVSLEDELHGPITFPANTLGDFIVVRSTGVPSYNFAVVVDDILMKITHVIRGEDHISNTPRQLLLYRFFGATPPKFAHHALIVGKDRAKLSKRHGVTSVSAFRERGYLPQALTNYLAYLGGHFPGPKEVYGADELANMFDLQSLSKKSATFDPDKLNWFNAQHLRLLSPDEAIRAMIPFLEKEGFNVNEYPAEWLAEAVEAILPNAVTLEDAVSFLRCFLSDEPEISEEARTQLAEPDTRPMLSTTADVISGVEAITPESVGSLLKSAQKRTELRGKRFYHPLRAALTGSTQGPELDKVLLVLGKQRVLERIHRALEMSKRDQG
ncbi:MAG: glutamate--tRNA ligase [Deltaproteobacteria bacterium]|nr:glutamate--tRNA ligase [Deltaproteobacteria bacterium]